MNALKSKQKQFEKYIGTALNDGYFHFQLSKLIINKGKSTSFWEYTRYVHYIYSIYQLIIILEYRDNPDRNNRGLQNYFCFLCKNFDQLDINHKNDARDYLFKSIRKLNSSKSIKNLMKIRDNNYFHLSSRKIDNSIYKVISFKVLDNLFNWVSSVLETLSLCIDSRSSEYRIQILRYLAEEIYETL